MSITQQDPPAELPDAEDDLNPDVSESIVDRLRRRREELAQEKTREFEIPIPGYKGLLGVRYRYPWADADRVIALAQRYAMGLVSDQVKVKLDEIVEIVVKCCHEIVCRDTETDPWRPLDPSGDEHNPLRFNERLAGLLQIDLPDPLPGQPRRSHGKFIARNVFSPAAAVTGIYEGDPALSQHGIALAGWLQKGDQDADEGLAGE